MEFRTYEFEMGDNCEGFVQFMQELMEEEKKRKRGNNSSDHILDSIRGLVEHHSNFYTKTNELEKYIEKELVELYGGSFDDINLTFAFVSSLGVNEWLEFHLTIPDHHDLNIGEVEKVTGFHYEGFDHHGYMFHYVSRENIKDGGY